MSWGENEGMALDRLYDDWAAFDECQDMDAGPPSVEPASLISQGRHMRRKIDAAGQLPLIVPEVDEG